MSSSLGGSNGGSPSIPRGMTPGSVHDVLSIEENATIKR
jgi:hypothetical protein